MTKLLIVDAHEDIGMTLSIVLKQYGIESLFVNNTDEAKYLLSIDHYNAVLLDPMVSQSKKGTLSADRGVDFCQYLIEYYKDMPVLICTAYRDKAFADKFKQASAFLLKPFKSEELVLAVAKCLGENAVGIKLPPENPKKKIQIFISYARDDHEKAHAIYTLLSHAGYSPWIDTEKLLPGQDWRHEISAAMETSHFIIACFSKNSVTKEGFVQKELKVALEILDEKPFSTIYIIPIRFDDCIVPNKFKKLHWFDMFSNNSAAMLLKAIESGYVQRDLLKSK